MRVLNDVFYFCTIQTESFGIGHRGWISSRELDMYDSYYDHITIDIRISASSRIKIIKKHIVTFQIDYNKSKRIYWEE